MIGCRLPERIPVVSPPPYYVSQAISLAALQDANNPASGVIRCLEVINHAGALGSASSTLITSSQLQKSVD
jgi:hypothetical protein